MGDEAIGFQVRYEGFTADAHQDAVIEVGNLDTKTVVGLTDTQTLNTRSSGTLRGASPCRSRSTRHSTARRADRVRALIGPSYNKGRTLLFSSSSNNTNNDDNNNVTPPPSG